MTWARGYKKSVGLATAALAGLLLVPAGLEAGPKEDQIVRSVLEEVGRAARRSPGLEAFGKDTLAQAQVLLDMGGASAPVLARALRDRRRDWKERYWAADMLAYVGSARSVPPLLASVRDRKERREVRLRACDSLAELGLSRKAELKGLRLKMRRTLKSIKDRKVRGKLLVAIARLRRG